MKITLSDLTTKDLATLTQRIISKADSGKYTVITGHPLLSEIKAEYINYDNAYSKTAFSGKGTLVANADLERDIAFRNLKKFLEGYKDMRLLPNYEMADDLYHLLKKYGLALDKMSYSSQTAQLKKLIEELDLAENQQKINTLFLTPTIGDLKEKQTAFEQLFAEQAAANAELRTMKSASAIRKALENLLKSFLNLITAMKNFPEWRILYADMNELVKAARNSDNN